MDYLRGKGAQINVANKFAAQHIETEDFDGLDEELIDGKPSIEIFQETPKKIISTNNSPDIGMNASINPYQGCEHGCVYCYARNSHEYWGFSAGLDFETKLVVKPDAPRLLESEFLKPTYKPRTIMLSGNTDCYQPIERKYELTRKLLEVFNKYQNPVGIITKNALVTRDIDILKELAQSNLVQVIFSVTSLNEKLRQKLEPRTASALKKLNAMELLTKEGIPVGVMEAPIIPGLNHHEIPEILKQASNAGASFASYTVVRLNGQISKIFHDWLIKNFPDRADKVWNQIQDLHGGNVNDTTFGRRIKGEGKISEVIRKLFEVSKRKYFGNKSFEPLTTSHFRRGGSYSLF
ncbi:PA0069 family radical SAM protein [Ekhidna sp. To15]|uniref:PA0069 family radical SAM protein n=1 Tax=Ekhidna sp. To15 TaxID=3395267 RepID=UPI003F527AC3